VGFLKGCPQILPPTRVKTTPCNQENHYSLSNFRKESQMEQIYPKINIDPNNSYYKINLDDEIQFVDGERLTESGAEKLGSELAVELNEIYEKLQQEKTKPTA
jgi:hypothetical protein